MHGQNISRNSRSPTASGAHILAARTYGIYIALYFALVLLCDHHRLDLHQSLVVLVLGAVVLYRAYPSFPTEHPSKIATTQTEAKALPEANILDTTSSIDATIPVCLVSETSPPDSFPSTAAKTTTTAAVVICLPENNHSKDSPLRRRPVSLAWADQTDPCDPPPPYNISHTTNNSNNSKCGIIMNNTNSPNPYHSFPSVFRFIVSVGGLFGALSALAYTTVSSCLSSPFYEIAQVVIGMVIVYCGHQVVKSVVSCAPDRASCKSREWSASLSDKPQVDCPTSMTTLTSNIDNETKLPSLNMKSAQDNVQETTILPVVAEQDQEKDDVLGRPESEMMPEKLEHGDVSVDESRRCIQEQVLEQVFEQGFEQELEQWIQALEQLEQPKSSVRLFCRETKSLDTCKGESKRVKRDCSIDLSYSEPSLPRLVSSMSLDSFMPYLALTAENSHQAPGPSNELDPRTARHSEETRGSLVTTKKMRRIERCPDIQQDDDEALSLLVPWRRSLSLSGTRQEDDEDKERFTTSMFAFPPTIERPFIQLSNSMCSFTSGYAEKEIHEASEYVMIKDGEWLQDRGVPAPAPATIHLSRSLSASFPGAGASMSLIKRTLQPQGSFMTHRRGHSDSQGHLQQHPGAQRSFFTLESDTLQSLFKFYRRKHAASTRKTQSSEEDDSGSEEMEKSISFVVCSNTLPMVRVGIYGAAQCRMWTSTGSIVLEPAQDAEEDN
ncbi:hypothetical protein BGZ94_006801 [Podila epigama]|nr:hypothetical protein BGZ94_006801 [Podila epigama]